MFFFFPVRNPEKSRALIGCRQVQFFTILIRTAHVSITILSYFAPKLNQRQARTESTWLWQKFRKCEWPFSACVFTDVNLNMLFNVRRAMCTPKPGEKVNMLFTGLGWPV